MIEEIALENVVPCVFQGNNVAISFSEVWGRDVKLLKGQKYLIEAESGTGKTSLCSYIIGTRTDFTGNILFDGKNSASLSSNKWADIRRKSLAWMPQNANLFPNLTLLENIQIKNELTDHLSEKRILEMLDALGLSERLDYQASKLSVGQQQRVAFVRMLCQPADFFIMDEPVSHLDVKNNSLIAEMLLSVASSTGAGIVITSVGNRLRIPDMKILQL